MLEAILAHTGGRIVIPDATEVVADETGSTVSFIDATGRVLVTFRREDLSVFMDEESKQMMDGGEGLTPKSTSRGSPVEDAAMPD